MVNIQDGKNCIMDDVQFDNGIIQAKEKDENIRYCASKFNYIQETEDDQWLIYNSFSKEIVRLSGISKERAKKLLDDKDGVVVNREKKEYELVRRGFLVEKGFDENSAIYAEYIKEIGSPILRLTIVPTYRCNFRCPYCYQDHENGMVMSKETQNAIIDYIKKNIAKYTGVEISWFGGEPLLCSDIILYINEEVKKICCKRYKRFRSAITTNGFLLSKELFTNLLDCGVRRFFITVDGLKENHDSQRYLVGGKGSYERIITNLQDIKNVKKTKQFSINVRTNVSKNLYEHLEEYVADMSSKFDDDERFAFFFRPVFDWGGESIEGFKANLLDKNKGMLDIFDKLLSSKYELNYLEHYMDLAETAVCYASKYNAYIINPDATINKCTCSELSGNNFVGKLLPSGAMELDYGKIGMWCEQYKDVELCENCYLQGQCLRSYCVSEQVMKAVKTCKCFISKNTSGKILLLLNKCNEKYHYIDDMEL